MADIIGSGVAFPLRVDRRGGLALVSSHDESDFGRRLDAAAAIGFIPKPELSGARLRHVLGSQS